jgi:hypothetical protein
MLENEPGSKRPPGVERSIEMIYEAFTEAITKLRIIQNILEKKMIANFKDFEELFYSLDKPLAFLRQLMFGSGNIIKNQPTEILVNMFLEFRMGGECLWIQSYENSFTNFIERNPPSADLQNDFLADLFDVGGFVIFDAIAKELWRRQVDNEDKNGKVIREFLVNKDVDYQALKRLIGLVLWRTEPLPGDLIRRECKNERDISRINEDKKSLASLHISQELKKYISMEIIGLDPDGLAAIVEGKFNRTGWKIRDHVRTEIRAEIRQANRNAGDSHLEMLPDNGLASQDNALETRMLYEKLPSLLPPRTKEFLQIRLQTETDAEAAEKMGITGAAASKHRTIIKKTLKELLN